MATDSEVVIKKRARYLFIVSLVVGLGIMYVFGTLAGLALNAIQGAQTRDTLVDCVEPTGKCFQEGQSRQADVVGALIDANELTEIETRRIILASIACDKIEGVDTLIEAEECVKDQLAEEKAEREANE